MPRPQLKDLPELKKVGIEGIVSIAVIHMYYICRKVLLTTHYMRSGIL